MDKEGSFRLELQQYPSWVEASTKSLTETTAGRYSSTLVGLKLMEAPHSSSSPASYSSTLVGLKRIRAAHHPQPTTCYSSTLVGLKQPQPSHHDFLHGVLQQYPSWVEANNELLKATRLAGYSSTLVGLKHADQATADDFVAGYSSTLVGLKRRPPRSPRAVRAVLQQYPSWVEAQCVLRWSIRGQRVTAVP